MFYYKKFNENNEVYIMASEIPPKYMDGLIEITEEEYNKIAEEITSEMEV